MRVLQQVAIEDAVSGGARIEITAGRGSFLEVFPLCGHGLNDDELYTHKLDLLMTLNNSADGIVTWRGERRSAAATGHPGDDVRVSVAALGLIAPTNEDALERMYQGWYNLNLEMCGLRAWPEPARITYLVQAGAPGAHYVGDPDDVAARIVHLHGYMGHTRHFLESLTLLATEVKPRVERLLARQR